MMIVTDKQLMVALAIILTFVALVTGALIVYPLVGLLWYSIYKQW